MRAMFRAVRIAVVAIPLALPFAGSTSAQETLPRSGEFSLTYSFVNPTAAVANIPRGENADIFLRTWVGAMVNNSPGDRFLNGVFGRCIATFRREGTVPVEIHGNCVFTDADGDQIWEQYDLYPGDSFPLIGRWVGGTGKYAGITGEFTIAALANGIVEGLFTTAGTKVGTYTLPPG